jgi:hypothetical protein
VIIMQHCINFKALRAAALRADGRRLRASPLNTFAECLKKGFLLVLGSLRLYAFENIVFPAAHALSLTYICLTTI